MSNATILDSRATLDMDLAGVKLVEASAGTGKTYAIGNLYMRMLLDGYAVAEILVVTFTKAATEELRGRIRQRIHDALIALEDIEHTRNAHKDEFFRLWAAYLTDEGAKLARCQLKLALTSMDEAAIYTIHGFCQRALTEHAFNSRQAFDVEMITNDSQIWEDAMKDWWRAHTYPMDVAELRLFTEAVGTLDSLISLQKPLRKPGVHLIPGENAWIELVAACKTLADIWESDKEKIQQVLESKALYHRGGFSLKKIPALIEMLEQFFSAGCPLDQVIERLSNVTRSKLLSVLKKDQEEPGLDENFFIHADAVFILARRLSYKSKAGNPASNKIRIDALRQANEYVHKKVNSVKQQSGQMAFDDQLLMLEYALTGSETLAQAICKHFPVAMIDEFQDTDAVQYSIFRHIYQPDAETDGRLIMIGDPKQAIYSFRGGDIFAYIKAKQDATEHYTLDTNWRSTPGLIKAVNYLFSIKDDPFIYKDIPFEPVKASGNDPRLLYHNGKAVTPLTMWQVPPGATGKPINKSALTPIMHSHTANEIVRLLTESREGRLTLADKPVHPGDIAVLVRGHAEASGLRDALRERGISAVAAGRKHVFESDEATGLKLLLAAVVDCKDAALLRQALASSLLGLNYTEIYQRLSSDTLWLDWTVQCSELHQTWSRRGFMAMFQQMLSQLHIGESVVQDRLAERRLTNLLHLGELLQQATQSVTGMDALLIWFEHQLCNASSGEDTELRLENDGDQVTIVTIHSSKGLEYPIVFLPYMWCCYPNRHTDELLPFYDEVEGCRYLDAGEDNAHLLLSEKERLAEDVRLTYVALTRACSKIYMAWGDVSFKFGSNYDSGVTAPGWLLHKGQQVADLATQKPQAFSSGSGSVAVDLEALCNESGQTIELVKLDSGRPEPLSLPADQEAAVSDIRTQIFTGDISEDWRISSFSSLTRDVHQHVSVVKKTDSSDQIFNVTAGSQTGLFLHALFEQMDFQSKDIKGFVQAFTSRNAVRYGLDPEQGSIIACWVEEVLHSTLDQSDLTLADIDMSQRMNELPFDFPVNKLDVNRLNRTLDKVSGRDLQPIQSYQNFSGFMTGVIDLIFEHGGRYYLADYKSNHLGYTLDSYAPTSLQQTVYERRYDLQYLIYSLALHRYLTLRVPDYDYNSHFGGVYYLFLRGMRAEHGSRYGVYYAKPELSLINELDQCIFNAEVQS